MRVISKLISFFRKPKPQPKNPTYRFAKVHVVRRGLIDEMREDYATELARAHVSRLWGMKETHN